MPFTFSHPAIILPLTYLPKRWFSLTGLVIGSITPDFEYFLRFRMESNYSHTFAGVFWLDLPLGLLLTFIFYGLVRKSLFDNLPVFLQSRFSDFRMFHWIGYFKKNWFIVIISILIGAGSHLFWDSFTHKYGYFVETIPWLRNTITILGTQIPVYKILQHSSSLIGGIIVAYCIFQLPENKNEIKKISLKYWLVILGFTSLFIIIGFLGGLKLKDLGSVMVTAISAFLLSLILTPMILRTRENN